VAQTDRQQFGKLTGDAGTHIPEQQRQHAGQQRHAGVQYRAQLRIVSMVGRQQHCREHDENSWRADNVREKGRQGEQLSSEVQETRGFS
jgi:hypothetical protein